MFKYAQWLLILVFGLAVAGCGGGSSTAGAGGAAAAANPWIGVWSLVSESGAPASGQLTLNATSFSQTVDFQGGTCTWTGSVSNVTATKLTITTATADGAPQCSAAVGQSATPSWDVSDDNNTLTLDYRGAIPLGTLQVWSRI